MDAGEEVKDVASELPQRAEPEEQMSDVSAVAVLHDAVAMQAEQRCQEIARGVVDKAAEGHPQSFKLIVEALKERERLRAAAVKTGGRSIASAWGAEPEWQGGTCANRVMGTAAAA